MSKSVRCASCKVCQNVSHGKKPSEVIFCPQQSQYRATAIFRTCDMYVSVPEKTGQAQPA